MSEEIVLSLVKMLLEQKSTAPKQNKFVGELCIIRAYAAGVHYGKVESIEGETVVLSDSIRLWSWKAADGVALSGLAQNGIDLQKSKTDSVNPLIMVNGVCEVIPVSDKFKESVKNAYKK